MGPRPERELMRRLTLSATSSATCGCASCDAVRRYAYVTSCCPRGLSHGVACICGAQVGYPMRPAGG